MEFSSTRVEYRFLLFILIFLSLWAVLRADVIFATFQKGGFAMSAFEYYSASGADMTREFFGYRGLQECPGVMYHHCKLVADADVGSLKDPMLATGYIAAFIGLWFSMGLEPLFRDLTAQLDRDHLLTWSTSDTERLEHRRLVWANGTAAVVGLTVLLGFVIFHYKGLPDWSNRLDWEHFVSAVILGILCGHRLGTAAAMGGIGRAACQQVKGLILTPDHADGMGGARRLGEFLAFQGLLISVPILWLGFWVLIVLNFPDLFRFFEQWIWPHSVLLGIALAISYFSFMRPLRILAQGCALAKGKLTAGWAKKSKDALRSFHDDAEHSADWVVVHVALGKAADITKTSEQIAALPEVPLRKLYSGSLSTVTVLPMLAFGVELLAPQNEGFLMLASQALTFLVDALS